MLNHPLLVVVLVQELVLELVQLMVELPQVPSRLVLVQLLEPPQLVLAYATHLWAL
jgi:hypothetical protein